ncbi:MAG: hypothetical protein ACFFAH_15810 [Promethearchaeota archaeon]
MKKSRAKIFTCLLIIHMFITIIFLISSNGAAIIEFEPEYGFAPEIDGEISRSKNEWENASKEIIYLKGHTEDAGIKTDLWVLQNGSDLYILVKFELELFAHKPGEFIAILISNSEAASNESFVDAKILQFTDLGGRSENHIYSDYYILNNEFFIDRDINGEAAAKLEDNEIIYEFRIPINNSEDDQDVFLDFGETYAFKIVYGEFADYPDSFKKSDIVLIDIEYPPKETENEWILIHNILCVIIFSGLGGLFAFYTYKVIAIKKKIRRVKK